MRPLGHNYSLYTHNFWNFDDIVRKRHRFSISDKLAVPAVFSQVAIVYSLGRSPFNWG
ncbi:MAG: hypothetical protein ACFB0G_07620 [Leptolyngbyaceae cyanobacterium]